MLGTVKFWNEKKGYGFIVPDDNDGDVIVHSSVVLRHGASSLLENARIDFEFDYNNRGRFATNINEILVGDIDEEMDYFPACVRWFSEKKGYGFVNVFGEDDDYFVHIKDVNRAGMSTLIAGNAIAVALGDTARGKQVVDVAAWMSMADSVEGGDE